MTKLPSEHEIQRAWCNWFGGVKYPEGHPLAGQWNTVPAKKPGVVFWHTPNGGTRSDAFEGKRLKEIGLLAGVPDILILWGGAYAIEFKKPGGVLSPAQRDLHPKLRTAGLVDLVTVDNLADAKAFCIRNLLTVIK